MAQDPNKPGTEGGTSGIAPQASTEGFEVDSVEEDVEVESEDE